MISSLLRGSCFIILLLGAHRVAGQDSNSAGGPAAPASNLGPSSDEPGSDASVSRSAPGGDATSAGEISIAVPPAQSAGDPATPPPEYLLELDNRVAKFKKLHLELEAAVGDQREAFIRYMNREPDSSLTKEPFFECRRKVRELLDETYLAALDIVRMGHDEEAATFMVTMIQHRFDLDIYDAATMEGAARMIDGGARLTFLYQAAARSAMVEGRFDMAKQLFETIDEDQKEELDLTLEFLMDDYKASFEAEKVIREKEAKENRLPRVAIQTTQGDLVVELFLDQAPSAVSHFIGLVDQGFYDDLDFHQVLDHLLALTGDSSGDGSGNSGDYLIDEHNREDARKGFRGSLVMAKLPIGETKKFVPNSASSQFAILFLPMISVTQEQTVFGRVIEGMDAISRLRRVDPSKKKKKGEIVLPPDRIIGATVIRRPDTLPEPEYFHPRQQ